MTDKEHKNLTAFYKALFTESDFVALSLIPVKRGTVQGIEKTISRAELLKTLTPAFIDKTIKDGRFPCVAPNPMTKNTQRGEKNVASLNAVFVDIDGQPLPAIADKAHFVFSRDDTHHHLYFMLDRLPPTDANKRAVNETIKELITLTGGDKAVHDPARVLRIPYSPHTKGATLSPGYRLKSVSREPRFAIDALRRIIRPPVTDTGVLTMTETAANRAEYLRQYHVKKGTINQGGGRSRFLFFVGLDCHGWGIDEADAVTLANELNTALCDPPEDAGVVEHQIKSAYRYRKAPFGDYADASAQAKDAKDRQRQLQRFEEVARVRDALTGFIYIVGAELLINKVNRMEYTSLTQQNNFLSHHCATRLTLPDLIREHAVNVVESLDFRPDIPADEYEADGVTYFNRHRPAVLPDRLDKKEARHAITTFTEHLRYLVNDETEFTTLLNYFAFICQNPGAKVSWSPLIVSQSHGIGKSILELLFVGIFGRKYVDAVESSALTQPQTDYMQDKIVVLAEEVEHGDRDVMNKLKSLISRSDVRINNKYQRSYTTKNTVNFFFFSNRIDAIRIDKFDRRLFVIFNYQKPKPREYYAELATVFQSAAHEIYHYLCGVDLSGFNAFERPAMTEGKQFLIDQSASELEIYLTEAMHNNAGEFETPMVSARKLLSDVEMYGPATIRGRVGIKAVQYFLLQHGYKPHDCHVYEEGQRVHRRLYYKGRAADFARLVEEINAKAGHGAAAHNQVGKVKGSK